MAAPVKDSVMQFKDGKVMIMSRGSWSALSAPVTTTNGRKVSPNGEVSKNKKTRKLEEGMMIDKDGQLMDKDGKTIGPNRLGITNNGLEKFYESRERSRLYSFEICFFVAGSNLSHACQNSL
jgi:hypothetical protein